MSVERLKAGIYHITFVQIFFSASDYHSVQSVDLIYFIMYLKQLYIKTKTSDLFMF